MQGYTGGSGSSRTVGGVQPPGLHEAAQGLLMCGTSCLTTRARGTLVPAAAPAPQPNAHMPHNNALCCCAPLSKCPQPLGTLPSRAVLPHWLAGTWKNPRNIAIPG